MPPEFPLDIDTSPSLAEFTPQSSSVLDNTQEIIQGRLKELALASNGYDRLDFVFDIADASAAQTILSNWSNGVFSSMTKIQVVADSVLLSSGGAYATETGTVYLAESTAQDPLLGERILAEEIGHHLDVLLNPGSDTLGDEGELFSRVLLGDEISRAELTRLRSENDHRLIKLNGTEVAVELDNTIGTAYNVGDLSGSRSFRSSVGSTDVNDYYRFYVADNLSDFRLSLTGLSADADVNLLDSSGSNIASSILSGSSSESINRQLTTGTYYAQVYQYSGNTDYDLNLTANTIDDFAANTSTTGSIAVGSSRTGIVNSESDRDWLRVSLQAGQTYQFNLDGNALEDSTLYLRNASGDQLAYNDDFTGLNSRITYTATRSGNYFLDAGAYSSGTGSYTLSTDTTTTTSNSFDSFSIFDASGDSTRQTIFQGGALQINYGLTNSASLSSVRLEASSNGSTIDLGSWSSASLSGGLVNLNDFSTLSGGDYQLRAVARTTSGQDIFSDAESLQILSWNPSSDTTYGTLAGDTLNYSSALDTGHVVVGRGGTDTLNLSGLSQSSVSGINGINLNSFNPTTSTDQAIFRGTAFDYLTLSDGREIYFQGIENLRFGDNSTLELQVRPDDTLYADQWNLRVSDVDSAWRFTRGADDVLLVSLDTGILTASGSPGSITDIATSRLITDPTDDDDFRNNGHGHMATSVMASTANNGFGVAGINWNSSVYMTDVYSGVSLQQGIREAIDYARATNRRVVFQGGIQGESWLEKGGTQAELKALIRDNADIAIFAVAAGNGSRDIDDTRIKQKDLDFFERQGIDFNPNIHQAVFSGGVARLQTNHSNVMSVGALSQTEGSTVNGLANAVSVDRASYSNYGASLTLMAATDSLAMNKFGTRQNFGGTSAANPNMAGIASLVWSVNSDLNGEQLRQILINTATDLGTTGRNDTFGNGLVNADAAVRRALALARNSQLAALYSGRSQFA